MMWGLGKPLVCRDRSAMRQRGEIQKLDNVTWYGHCVIHITMAIRDLPAEAKLALCRDLRAYLQRVEAELRRAR